MMYSILKEQNPYLPIKKLVITQNQLEMTDVNSQVYSWVDEAMHIPDYSTEMSINNFLKKLNQGNELVIHNIKITSERCSCGWVLTLYLQRPSLSLETITEEEFSLRTV